MGVLPAPRLAWVVLSVNMPLGGGGGSRGRKAAVLDASREVSFQAAAPAAAAAAPADRELLDAAVHSAACAPL